jgi:PQQ-dependent catabolism-associated beta-propeller protein
MMAPPKQPEASAGVRQLEHLRSAWNSFRPAIGKFMFRTESLLARPREVPTSRALWLLTGALLLSAPFCAQAGRAYVTNEDGESVSVLDTDRAEVVATVNVGKRPRGMKLSRDGKELFVAVSGLPKCPPSVPDEECAKLKRDLTADGIAVIDTTTLKLNRLLKSGSDPEQFDLSHDGKRLFISNEDSGTLTVVGIASGAVEATVPVGKEPEGVRVTPDGRWIVVTSESGNAIYVIDAHTLKMVKSVPVGKRPRDVAFAPDSRTVYVSGEFDASVYTTTIGDSASAADSASAVKLVQLRPEARPMGVVLDALHKRLFVSTGRGGTIAVVSLEGDPKLVTEIQVGARPWGMALSHDGKRLYTANGSSNDVTIIDTTTLQVLKKVAVGKSPWGVVLDSRG